MIAVCETRAICCAKGPIARSPLTPEGGPVGGLIGSLPAVAATLSCDAKAAIVLKVPHWVVPSAIITEGRILTSDKNKKWAGYILKLACAGLTLEVQTDEATYRAYGAGMEVSARGTFELFNGRMRYIMTDIAAKAEPAKVGPAAAAK